ncbi:MAG: enoyl-CoA hydratase/isomerase family protein [Solirubrobacteraceae bacterium]|nr:enoyl-CoA hydratase/isomerase family protein [Solirubrobacteraceae bacterium]
MPGQLRVDRPAEGVVRLTFANPTKRNALDHAILDAITSAVAEHDDARCILLTGEGAMFSAGYDLSDLPEDGFAAAAEELVAHPFADALDALEGTDVPTVAALPGHAIGGGLELALVCDFRVAADTAKLGMPPAKLGLVYSHTGLRRFIDAIGINRTRELFLLGRYIDATTGLDWGLVNRVVDAEEVETTALSLAGKLAGNAPLSLRGNKRVLRELLKAERELDPAIEQELIDLRHSCFDSEDFAEGVKAFAEKRPPRWQGR